MFEGTVVMGKNAWTPSGQIPKESIKGFGDSSDNKEFVDPQCQSPVDVDPMDVECSLLSKARLEMNKGKGLARNVQLFKGIHKKHGKKHSVAQELSDSLKSMTDVIIESKSVSSPTPFTSASASEVQAVGHGFESSWGAIR
ncbi:hypothetical protein SO802_001750 [Lithocarpus litseifolius]|uniref:Uncharacterized protein n=1 Tax=Lithocarpus litseifolius TaxID=425828 RepID=A0AAW2DW98_9ROSI